MKLEAVETKFSFKIGREDEAADPRKYENLVNQFMKNNNYVHYKKISNNDHLYKKNKRKNI